MADHRLRAVRLRLNCHQLRALICLVARVRLTPLERRDLAGATAELERAVRCAAVVAPKRPRKAKRRRSEHAQHAAELGRVRVQKRALAG